MGKYLDLGGGAHTISRRDLLKLAAGAALAVRAGKVSAQSPAGRPISIDLHTHWAPEAYLKALAPLNPPPTSTPTPLDFDLNERLKWMDDHGVQTHVLTLSGAMPWQWVPPDAGALLAQIANDAAIEAHTAFPDRFYGGIELSIRDPQVALKELNRVAGKPGMRAVHLPNSIESKDYLFVPEYEPLLARCEELGYPLLFHPFEQAVNYYSPRVGDALSVSAFLNNSLGYPFEHATTAAKFIITGTLDRHPKLEIVLPHSGGAFPYIAGRIHHDFMTTAARGDLKLQHPFMYYLRRFHYDSLAFYPETLRFMINRVGSDRVVIGSDTFAVMDVEEPNALVEQLKLPPADRERILRGNAMRLLGI